MDYLDTVLQAQGDVENAIIAYLKSHEQLQSYELAAAASQRAVNVATIQYQEGYTDFNTLVTTLVSNVQQQDLLSSARGSVATNLVQVYRALGGGWQLRGEDDFIAEDLKQQMRSRTDWGKILNE